MLKRLFDIILSSIALVILFPFFLIISLLVKLDSKGRVFFMAERVGKGGKVFRMFKFRTMVEGADKMGIYSTASDDKRLTRIGKFLKRFQLDELPQFINVLKGNMSVVGPRPEVKHYVDMMTEQEKDVILSVRPGITDLASLANFHEGEMLKGSKDPDRVYMEEIRPKKIELQVKYVKEQSFILDLKIIFKTLINLFK